MNITFMLGNGFDIQLGLLTRYSDFLQEYVQITPDDNDNIMEFKNHLTQKPAQELWSDAERAMGVHLGNYSDTNVEEYNQRVQDFESKMVEYLKQQQERYSFSDGTQIAACFTDFLFNSFNDILTSRRDNIDISRREDHAYHFVTFNYTNLLEKIRDCCVSSGSTIRRREWYGKKCFDSWESIIHVHGALNSKIIMGVNDESQLDLSGGATLTEALRWELIKPALNHDYGSNFDLPAKNVIAKSNIIIIYGVSYGDTDKLWWEEIVKWLKQDSAHKLIAFIRDKSKHFDSPLAFPELTYENSKRREILKKLRVEESSPDVEKLINQIYIILNTTRLNLKELLLPNSTDDYIVDVSTDSDSLVTV